MLFFFKVGRKSRVESREGVLGFVYYSFVFRFFLGSIYRFLFLGIFKFLSYFLV